MTLLILGVALWWAAHFFKRVAPGARAQLGRPGMGLMAVLIVASIVLMVMGYRAADGTFYWGRSPAKVGINNLLMIGAFYLFATSGPGPGKPRNWLGTKLRHPMLLGFSVWAVAHVLVNGDTPSFILFGGLLVWACAEIIVINAQEGPWTPPAHGGRAKEISAIIGTLVMLIVVMGLHFWLGVQPWG